MKELIFISLIAFVAYLAYSDDSIPSRADVKEYGRSVKIHF